MTNWAGSLPIALEKFKEQFASKLHGGRFVSLCACIIGVQEQVALLESQVSNADLVWLQQKMCTDRERKRAEKAEHELAEMKRNPWTDEPTVEGWYWCARVADMEIVPVHLIDFPDGTQQIHNMFHGLHYSNKEDRYYVGARWSGPIPTPQRHYQEEE